MIGTSLLFQRLLDRGKDEKFKEDILREMRKGFASINQEMQAGFKSTHQDLGKTFQKIAEMEESLGKNTK